jgi:hypothetical protein
VGTDTSTCDAVLKIMNETPTTESEIEIHVIESSHEFDICDVSCQTEDNYETYKDIKAEINVLP